MKQQNLFHSKHVDDLLSYILLLFRYFLQGSVGESAGG